MQEEPIPLAKEVMIASGWSKRNPWSPHHLHNDALPNEDYLAPLEAWNHPITQKAWSDELVQVARELVKYQYSPVTSSVVYHLRRLYDEDGKVGCTYEKILNKYGRSLSE